MVVGDGDCRVGCDGVSKLLESAGLIVERDGSIEVSFLHDVRIRVFEGFSLPVLRIFEDRTVHLHVGQGRICHQCRP